ncbi:MAG: hypothetical protein Q9227_000281 [Pyrenula ochraceoflavens]
MSMTEEQQKAEQAFRDKLQWVIDEAKIDDDRGIMPWKMDMKFKAREEDELSKDLENFAEMLGPACLEKAKAINARRTKMLMRNHMARNFLINIKSVKEEIGKEPGSSTAES